jgi:hypothetical protein
MIHHLSIPAADPQHVATTLVELFHLLTEEMTREYLQATAVLRKSRTGRQ